MFFPIQRVLISNSQFFSLLNKDDMLRCHTKTHAGFRLVCSSTLCCYATWSQLTVSELQLSATTSLWFYHPVAPELNRIHLSVVCCCGQSGWVIDWQDAAYSLPNALVHISPMHLYIYRQCTCTYITIKVAMWPTKVVWKQHKTSQLYIQIPLTNYVHLIMQYHCCFFKLGVVVRVHQGYNVATALCCSSCWSSCSMPSKLLKLGSNNRGTAFNGTSYRKNLAKESWN